MFVQKVLVVDLPISQMSLKVRKLYNILGDIEVHLDFELLQQTAEDKCS